MIGEDSKLILTKMVREKMCFVLIYIKSTPNKLKLGFFKQKIAEFPIFWSKFITKIYFSLMKTLLKGYNSTSNDL